MPRGPKGEKRPADAIGNAIMIARIATGELEDIIDRVMKMTDVVALIDAANPVPAVRGPYKKTAEISN